MIVWTLLLSLTLPPGSRLVSEPSDVPYLEHTKITRVQRDEAVLRGVNFVYQTALDPKNLADHASDYLWFFLSITQSTDQQELQKRARDYGQHVGRAWLKKKRGRFSRHMHADHILDTALILNFVEKLGLGAPGLRKKIDRLARRKSTRQYIGFNPYGKAPMRSRTLEGADACRAQNRTGSSCKPYKVTTPDYDAWYDGLISAYFAEKAQLDIGITFAAFVEQMNALYPYPTRASIGADAFEDLTFLVTHRVYTQSDYGLRKAPRAKLGPEYQFLRQTFARVVKEDDVETYAEYVDTLRSLGVTADDEPLLAEAITRLVESQNPDGSWGDPYWTDIYDRYHATWTAVDALRSYRAF